MLMRRLRHELTLCAVALQFLTRFPVRLAAFDPAWLHASARYFPIVGAMVGALGALVLIGSAWAWPLSIAVALSVLATIVFTGAFHEDGLADTCDALGGAVSRQRALEIMKDSRIGTYGALGLILVIGLKTLALLELAWHSLAFASAALILAHTVSRLATVVLLRALPYAGDPAHAKAKPMAQQVGNAGFAAAIVGTFAVCVVLLWLTPLRPGDAALALGSGAVCTVLCHVWLRNRLGGYTGDTLGATQQLCELAIYLALCANALQA